MLAMIVVTMVFLTLAAASVWSLYFDRDEDEKAERAAKQPAGPEPVARPLTLEGVLVGQLLSREISRRVYLREMGRLAERDADRHPLTVPPAP